MLVSLTKQHIRRFRDVQTWSFDHGGAPAVTLTRADCQVIQDLVDVGLIDSSDDDQIYQPSSFGWKVLEAMTNPETRPEFVVRAAGRTRVCLPAAKLAMMEN